MEKRLTNKILGENLDKHIWETEIAIAYITYRRNDVHKITGIFEDFKCRELIDKLNRPLSIMKSVVGADLTDEDNYRVVLSYICISMAERGSSEFRSNEFNTFRNTYIRDNKLEELLNDI